MIQLKPTLNPRSDSGTNPTGYKGDQITSVQAISLLNLSNKKKVHEMLILYYHQNKIVQKVNEPIVHVRECTLRFAHARGRVFGVQLYKK